MKRIITSICLSLMVMVGGFSSAFAATETVPPPYQNERYILAGVIVFLSIIIAVLGKTVVVSTLVKREKIKQEKNKVSKSAVSIVGIIIALCTSMSSFAQDTAEKEPKEPHWFTTVPADIIVLIIIAVIQFVIIAILAKTQLSLIYDKKKKAQPVVSADEKWAKFFTKWNNTVPIEKEDELDLHHDYDGIRELDNSIPRWWLLSFLGTVIIAAIYMYRMFVTETLPDQITELESDYVVAEMKMKEYLKNSANNVDENTVVMLDASGIEAGQRMYTTMGCATCHGEVGEGNAVGPNLTDEYWLHKGSLSDIFYSIKYGWPEKGMKSWQSDMSPMQIAQVSSYIKSLQGSNPANAKAPQGELYVEESSENTPENVDEKAEEGAVTVL